MTTTAKHSVESIIDAFRICQRTSSGVLEAMGMGIDRRFPAHEYEYLTVKDAQRHASGFPNVKTLDISGCAEKILDGYTFVHGTSAFFLDNNCNRVTKILDTLRNADNIVTSFFESCQARSKQSLTSDHKYWATLVCSNNFYVANVNVTLQCKYVEEHRASTFRDKCELEICNIDLGNFLIPDIATRKIGEAICSKLSVNI